MYHEVLLVLHLFSLFFYNLNNFDWISWGRYSWPFKALLRSILTLPFVIPAIIAAMGVLTITGPYGLDIRTEESTWWWTLILSHAWFNIALIIRFRASSVTLNPNLEEQLLLLPNGVTFYSRLKNLWIPVLAPAVAAASCMTFVFSFTSFALVKWITVRDKTLVAWPKSLLHQEFRGIWNLLQILFFL